MIKSVSLMSMADMPWQDNASIGDTNLGTKKMKLRHKSLNEEDGAVDEKEAL